MRKLIKSVWSTFYCGHCDDYGHTTAACPFKVTSTHTLHG